MLWFFCGPFLHLIHCSWNQGALDHKSRYVLILDSAPGSADGLGPFAQLRDCCVSRVGALRNKAAPASHCLFANT